MAAPRFLLLLCQIFSLIEQRQSENEGYVLDGNVWKERERECVRVCVCVCVCVREREREKGQREIE
jgi:hypothetical protein